MSGTISHPSAPCQILRRLKLAAALACLLAALTVVVLWIHSSRWQDTLYYVPPHGSRIYRIDTYPGTMYVGAGLRPSALIAHQLGFFRHTTVCDDAEAPDS